MPGPPVVLVFGHRARRGGVPTHLGHLARALPTQSLRPVFAVPRDAEYRPDLAALGASIVDWDQAGKLDVLASYRAAELVRETGAELVHTHARPVDLWAGLGARLAGVPSVATLHAEPARTPDGRVALGVRARAHGFVLQHVHARAIVVARAFVALASERLGLAPAHTVVVENGVDLAASPPDDATRARARTLLGASPGEVAVGCVARFVDAGSLEKGHPDLLRALARTATKPRVHLVGEGPSEPALRTLARDLGLAERVVFHGARPSRDVLPGLDLLVLPSRSEGCPYVLLEALASGVATLAASTGGVPEILEGGAAGALVPPADEGALAAALDSLVADEPARRALAARGLARARARYGLERFGRETADVYRSVLSRGVLA